MRPGSILSTTKQTKQTKNGEAEKSEKRSYRAMKWAQPGCLHELHWGRRSSTERSVPILSTLETKSPEGGAYYKDICLVLNQNGEEESELNL